MRTKLTVKGKAGDPMQEGENCHWVEVVPLALSEAQPMVTHDEPFHWYMAAYEPAGYHSAMYSEPPSQLPVDALLSVFM